MKPSSDPKISNFDNDAKSNNRKASDDPHFKMVLIQTAEEEHEN